MVAGAAYCSTVMLAARITLPQSWASAFTNSPIPLVSRLLASTKIAFNFACASGVCLYASNLGAPDLTSIGASGQGVAFFQRYVSGTVPLP